MFNSMKKTILVTAALSSALTLLAVFGFGFAALPTEVKLDNKRVKVSTVTYEPGVPRERYIRPTDQVIVFLDDCRYERTDPATGQKTVRERKSGDVIWHDGRGGPVQTHVPNAHPALIKRVLWDRVQGRLTPSGALDPTFKNGQSPIDIYSLTKLPDEIGRAHV